VLLISPLPKIDPPCGDVTYTETLLQNSPAGVEYVTYAEAIAAGALVEQRNRADMWRRPLQTGIAKGINILRKRRLLFWEPFRFFWIKPGEFDLVHLHVFSARMDAIDCPIVTSNALPLRNLYRDARHYSEGRLARIERVEYRLAKWMGINHLSYYQPQATRAIAFTEYLKNWYVKKHIMPAEQVDVVPIYLPTRPIANGNKLPSHIGFVAKDFHAKGGSILLEAFNRVLDSRPDSILTIVGCPSELPEEELRRRNIRWLPYVKREQLLDEIFPSFDVFAYPTKFDGQPLVILEAMSMGIPVVTSNYGAMSEMVDEGRAGIISKMGDAAALAENILSLLNPERNEQVRHATRRYFEATFSMEAVRPKLRACYDRAICKFSSNDRAKSRSVA
jgi:glycosyltransferase involved in cell wall biosynthesis